MTSSRGRARAAAAAGAGASAGARLADEILAAVAALPSRATPIVRGLRRAWSKRLAGEPAGEVVGVAKAMLRRDDGEVCRFLACELIASHPAALASLDVAAVEDLGRGMASWSAVDCFSCFVAGPAWREGQLPDAAVLAWAASPDRWWRRAAVVAAVPLVARARGGRGEPGDVARALTVCASVVNDRDDMVVKALSWALREVAKRDAASVEGFLRDHAGRLAPRVVREVNAKLTTGRKNPRRGEPSR